MIERRPGEGRYAHLEREQRWLLAGVPRGAERTGLIEDRYLTGTRLRPGKAWRRWPEVAGFDRQVPATFGGDGAGDVEGPLPRCPRPRARRALLG